MKRSLIFLVFLALLTPAKTYSQNGIGFPDSISSNVIWFELVIDSISNPITDSFTVEFWFRHNSIHIPGLSTTGNFIRVEAFDDYLWGVNGFSLRSFYDGLGYSQGFLNCFGNCDGTGLNKPSQDTLWHHIAGVNRGDSLFLFVDGLLASSDTIRYGCAETNTYGFQIIGASTEIDQLRIWNSVRTPAQILSFKDSCISYHPNLVHLAPFESLVGSDSVQDLSDNRQIGYLAPSQFGYGPSKPFWVKGVKCTGCDHGLDTSYIFEDTTICQDSSINIYGTQFSNVQSSFSHTTNLSGLACDSIITTNVNVISNWTNIIQTLCLGDDLALPNGDTVYDIQGYYTDSILWIDRGCPHTIALQLDVDSAVNDSVSVNNYTLTSHAGTQNSFQWLDCNNGMMIIPGAVNRSYTPGPAGSYSVLITTPRGCVDTSECVSVPHVGIEGSILSEEIRIFPNPVRDYLHLILENDLELDLSIRDLRGKNVIIGTWFSGGRIELDLTSLVSGVYFLELCSRDQKQVLKILKQ